MARKPNYNFEKNRKEQARRKKQEEKLLRKRSSREDTDSPSADVDPSSAPVMPPESGRQ